MTSGREQRRECASKRRGRVARAVPRALVGVVFASPFALASATAAHAAEPTVAQCLAASDDCLTARTAKRLRDARAQALVCASRACPGEIRVECTKRAATYGALIPTIVFDARNDAGDDLSKVSVTVDGAPFADALDGTAIEVDPGEHAFVFTSGDLYARKTFVLREGEKSRRERIVLRAGGATAGTSGTASAVGSDGTPLVSDAPAGDGYRLAGYVVGGAGILGLGLATYFGLNAASHWSSSQSECKSSSNCVDHASAVRDHDSASDSGLASTVAFAVGGAALTAGILLVVLAPSQPAGRSSSQSRQRFTLGGVQLVPLLAPSSGGLSAQGTF